jgi:hypothetical protein
VDDPGRHSELPDAVLRGLEPHHGRGHGGGDTDELALFFVFQRQLVESMKTSGFK